MAPATTGRNRSSSSRHHVSCHQPRIGFGGGGGASILFGCAHLGAVDACIRGDQCGGLACSPAGRAPSRPRTLAALGHSRQPDHARFSWCFSGYACACCPDQRCCEYECQWCSCGGFVLSRLNWRRSEPSVFFLPL